MRVPTNTVGCVLMCLVAGLTQVCLADELGLLVSQVAGGPGRTRDQAIERLRFIGPSRAGPRLRPLLSSEEVQARIGGALAVGVVGDTSAAAALEPLLRDEDWEVRRNAVQSLAALKRTAAAPKMGRLLGTDPNPRVRLAAAKALGVLYRQASSLASAARSDVELENRLAALHALAGFPDAGEVAAVAPLLSDQSQLVQFGAARALCWSGDARSRTYLTAALKSGDEERARRAVSALADCPRGWVPELLALAAGQSGTAAAACDAMASRGDALSLRHLERLAASRGPASEPASLALARARQGSR
jgi:HEAT repeat protein